MSERGAGPSTAGLDDNTLLAAYGAGLAVTVGGSVLLAGPLAGLLSGRGWAASADSVPVTVLSALVKGPGSVYHPAPPSWLFYGLTVFFVLALGAVIVKVAGAVSFGGRTGGAQWGGAKTERKMYAANDPAQRVNRITAGRGLRTNNILAAQPNISATVFGVPGSSKTTGLVLPNAAEWQGALVVTTKAADRMASWLAEASASGGDKRAAPWVDQAKSVLKGILLAAHLSGGGISDLRRWISLGKDALDHVRAVLLAHGFTEVADDYASPWLRLHEDGVGSIQFSLNVLARVFADEEVRETCSKSDFTFEEWLDRKGTICVIASEADADRFAPLISSLIAGAIHAAEARYNATGKPIDPAVGFLVDEAGNMLRYPRLPAILTTGRGMGIAMLTVWHDLSQLRESLGVQKANTVLSASGLRMLLPGCGDLETLRYFSGLYGRTEVLKTSHGRSRGEHSTNTQATETDLAPVHSLQQLPVFTAIAQYTNLPPIKVRMRLTFRDKDLKKLLAQAEDPKPVPAEKQGRRASRTSRGSRP
ncbi:type IV secretory system conjugative DNA transfer family protein [Streptomyces sp. NPDC054956]